MKRYETRERRAINTLIMGVIVIAILSLASAIWTTIQEAKIKKLEAEHRARWPTN